MTREPPQRLEPLAVDLREAARMLGLGWRTVHRLAMTGELPSVLVGRRRLFPVATLTAWLDARLNAGAVRDEAR